MKKILYLMAICAGFMFTSCEKDEPGGTETVSLAGEWYVVVDLADASGNVVAPDCYGIGKAIHKTYNTAANVPTEMYLDDDGGNFWDYKVRVQCDVNSLTFASNGAVANEAYDCNVTIEGGKVLPGAGVTPHGTPADSIVYYVSFSDDEPNTKYKVSGIRYTGLAEDD